MTIERYEESPATDDDPSPQSATDERSPEEGARRFRIPAPAFWGFYLLIVFEILYMISPFALYFYSAYGPALNVLHRTQWTAWLTTFFLPHFSHTTSPLLEAVEPAAALLALLGLGIFLVGFAQIYWAKLRGRGAVTGGLYRAVRHPQYLGLALLGLGTTLWWPRFLVLLVFATMLSLYGALARQEEARCLERFGEDYRAYLDRTGRFLPRRLTELLPGLERGPDRPRRPLAALGRFAATLALAAVIGFLLRDFSLARISGLYEERAAVLSPAVLDPAELESAYRLAISSPEAQRRLAEAGSPERLLVYVLPMEWYLADLPVEAVRSHQGHYTPADFDRRRYKVLITEPRTHSPESLGVDIVRTAYGRSPVALVKLDIGSGVAAGTAPAPADGEILAVESPPAHVVWGDIPTPAF